MRDQCAWIGELIPTPSARDGSYQKALSEQPTYPGLHYTEFKLLAGLCFAVGGILVVSSMWALGVTGTYLGDYFVRLAVEPVQAARISLT